jgi:hypothetical protein
MSDGLVHDVVVLANMALALLSGVSSVVAVARPGVALAKGAPITAGIHFYARAYAVRAVPLSLVALAMLPTATRAALVPMLLVLGAAQAGDSVLGIRLRNRGMAIGAGMGAVVHLLSAWWIATH